MGTIQYVFDVLRGDLKSITITIIICTGCRTEDNDWSNIFARVSSLQVIDDTIWQKNTLARVVEYVIT
jgi:hypothetical protein